jgi:MoaA/NifB/PqqE/SkfB family radical SAM enzyme
MGHKYVKWDFTGRCNLRCTHCSVGKLYFDGDRGHIEELTTEQRLEIVDKLADAGVNAVSFLGGEPLLLKDRFFRVASQCATRGIATTVVSNGLLLDEETVAGLIKARIGTIVISVDGASAATHDFIRGKGTFERVRRNLHGLLTTIKDQHHDVKVRVNTVLNRRNASEIGAMLNLWTQYGIDEWGVLALGGVGYAEEHLDELRLSTKQEVQAAMEFAKCWNARPSNSNLDVFPQFIYPVVADFIKAELGLDVPRPMLCCNAAINLGYIRPDGTMYACDRIPNDRYLGHQIDGAPIQRMSLLDNSFYDIWNSGYFQALFSFILRKRTYQHYDPCNHCKYLFDQTCNPCPLYSLDANVVVGTCKLIEDWSGGFQQTKETLHTERRLDALEAIQLGTRDELEELAFDAKRIPIHRSGVRSHSEDDQLILMNPFNVTFVALNPMARMLWESVDGKRCLADFVNDVAQVADGVKEAISVGSPAIDFSRQLTPTVNGFFRALERKGLIEWL